MSRLFLTIFLFSLSVLVSSKKRGFVKKDYSEENFSNSEENFSNSEESSMERKIPSKLAKHRERQFDFSGRLRKTFALEIFLSNEDRNIACSPVSALMPLAKLALGAEGASQRALLDAIGVSTKSKIKHKFRKIIKQLKNVPGVKLIVASRIFVSNQAQLNRSFTKETSKIFKSSVEALDFNNVKESENKINLWIGGESGKSTGLKLEYTLSGVQSALLLNLVTFEGDWEVSFRKTSPKKFYSPKGVVTVPMMYREGYYNYAKSNSLNAQVLEIPYEKKQASLVVVLPFSKTGLSVLLKQLKLAPELLNDAMEEMSSEKVILSLPKFRIQSHEDITSVYKSMGLQKVFSEKSGLTGIMIGRQMAISAAMQVTIIDVNEKGTEAAAATAIEIVQVSLNLNQVVFNADHPFLFYVRSENEQIFAGIFTG